MSPSFSLARLPLLFAPAVLLACSDGLGPHDPATIVITPENPRVVMGQTLQLTATVVDRSGQEIPGLDVEFESRIPAVITVSETGLLTSVGPGGGSTIIATHGDLTAMVMAEVALPPSILFVSPASLELKSGEGAQLFATVTDENSETVTSSEFAFRSDDPSVVTVDPEGTSNGQASAWVTAKAPGTTIITVSSGEREFQVSVRVRQVPPKAIITPLSVVLAPGGVQQLTATVIGETPSDVPASEFTWTSSDETVVTVSRTGEARSVGPEGSAIVTATGGGFTIYRGVFVGTAPDPVRVARVPHDRPGGVAWSPDGSRYFIASVFGVGLVSGTVDDFGSLDSVSIAGRMDDVVSNPTGSLAYIAATRLREEGGINLVEPGIVAVNPAAGAVTDFIPVDAGYPNCIEISADGGTLVLGTTEGIELLDLASGTFHGGSAIGHVSKITRHPLRPVFHATVPHVGVYEIDAVSGEVTRTFPARIETHAVSPDGTRLYASGRDEVIRVWNLDTGAEERSLPSFGGFDMAVTPDGKFLYLVWGAELRLVDPRSGALVGTLDLGGQGGQIAVSRDGIAAITNEDWSSGAGWIDFVR